MERLALVAISILWLGGLAALGYVVLSGGDGDGGGAEARSQIAPEVDARGCDERVRGGRVTADPRRDSMLGPVTFVEAPGTYRTSFRGRAYVTPDFLPGLNAHPMDVIALVDAGTQARLSVPRRQRRWMRLFYRPGDETGQDAITLQACGRSDTPFDGGLYVDFDNAPRGGRCAELEVRVPVQSTTYRGQLFGPRPGECRSLAVRVSPSRGRPNTVFEVSFRSAARLGVSRAQRRSYRASVDGPEKRGCAFEGDAFADRGRPGNRVVLGLAPGRAKNSRWCRGRYHGVLARVNSYACPARGPCQPPPNFPRREQTVGRFSFVVR